MLNSSLSHRVLIADSDVALAESLARYLRGAGLMACTAQGLNSLHQVLATEPVDLVVLDALLPGDDGLALLRDLRSRLRIPVIMTKQGCDTFDRVLGLESGADDYLAKPFLPRELTARIHSVLRRLCGQGTSVRDVSEVVHFDGWQLHCMERYLTTPAGVAVPLAATEFRLLCTFLSMPRRIFSRRRLMADPYGRSLDLCERSVDLAVSRLRRKLGDDPRAPMFIKTARGIGYLFEVREVKGRIAWPS